MLHIRVDTLLGNDCETVRQQLLLGSGLHTIMEVLLEVVFSVLLA
jgi:hypothetical protein